MKIFKQQTDELIRKRKEFLKHQEGQDIVLLPYGRTLIDREINILIQAGESFLLTLKETEKYFEYLNGKLGVYITTRQINLKEWNVNRDAIKEIEDSIKQLKEVLN